MSIDAPVFLAAIAIGVGATLFMDLWNLFLRRAFGVPSLNYCMLGRWVRHMPDGTFHHASIAAARPKSMECAVGWVSHYSIGVALALTFVALAGDWIVRPALLPALLFGLVTVVFPFFVMQPALGLGVASARTSRPAQARVKSAATHLVFGLGMYLTALVVASAL